MIFDALKKTWGKPNLPVTKDDGKLEKLIKQEAQIGGRLFGAVPEGRGRLFYCQEPGKWVWRETWTNPDGAQQTLDTVYQIQADKIIKHQDGIRPIALTLTEAKNLTNAVQWYVYLVAKHLYRQVT